MNLFIIFASSAESCFFSLSTIWDAKIWRIKSDIDILLDIDKYVNMYV